MLCFFVERVHSWFGLSLENISTFKKTPVIHHNIIATLFLFSTNTKYTVDFKGVPKLGSKMEQSRRASESENFITSSILSFLNNHLQSSHLK